jgi:hypothetical protein
MGASDASFPFDGQRTRQWLFTTVYPVVGQVIEQQMEEYQRTVEVSAQLITDLNHRVEELETQHDRILRLLQVRAVEKPDESYPDVWMNPAVGGVPGEEPWVASASPSHPPLQWPSPLRMDLHHLPPYLRLLEGGPARQTLPEQ